MLLSSGVEVLEMAKHLSDKYIIYISQSVVNASAGKYVLKAGKYEDVLKCLLEIIFN